MAEVVLGTKFFLDHFRFLDEFLGTDPTEIKMVLDYYIKLGDGKAAPTNLQLHH